MRPRCCFRYLTFFGINMAKILSACLGLRLRWRLVLPGPRRGFSLFWPRLRLPGWRRGQLGRRRLHDWSGGFRTGGFAFFAAPAARFAIILQGRSAAGSIEHFALIDPDLDADDAVGRIGLAEAVIDVSAQGVQRQLSLQIPFAARDLGAI